VKTKRPRIPTLLTLPNMPDELKAGPAFRDLVRNRVARAWLPMSAIEDSCPPHYRDHLSLGDAVSHRDLKEYNRMLLNQVENGGTTQRIENQSDPICPHRTKFAFHGSRTLTQDGKNLALLCGLERASDYANPVATGVGSSARDRADFNLLTSELRMAWGDIVSCCDLNRPLGIPTLRTVTANVCVLLERRYSRLARILFPGEAREEILANAARQYYEVGLYLPALESDLVGRGSALPYERQAHFVNSHYFNFLRHAMNAFLEPSTGDIPGGVLLALGSAALPHRTRLPWPCAPFCPAGSLCPSPTLSRLPPPRRPTPFRHLTIKARLLLTTCLRLGHSRRLASYSPASGGWPVHAPLAAATPVFSPAAFPPHVSPSSTFTSASAPSQPRLKNSNLTGKALARANAGLEFCGIPQHAYVIGEDCAIPGPLHRNPRCPCLDLTYTAPAETPGQHASWDCPLRFWRVLRACPGFHPDGSRDPSQWLGPNLAPAAKRAWLDLINKEELPLPSNKSCRMPPFHM
jgi:hypothetical protein